MVIKSRWVFHSALIILRRTAFWDGWINIENIIRGKWGPKAAFQSAGCWVYLQTPKELVSFHGLPCQTMVTLEYNMAGLGESAVWGLVAGAEASSIFLRLSVLPREGIILRELLCCWAIRWLSSWHKGSRKRIGQEGLVVYRNCNLSWLMGWAWEAELNLELLKR